MLRLLEGCALEGTFSGKLAFAAFRADFTRPSVCWMAA